MNMISTALLLRLLLVIILGLTEALSPSSSSFSFSSLLSRTAGSRTFLSASTTTSGATAVAREETGTASSGTGTSGTIILADESEFIKPDRDRRQYRVVRLQNNLQVLLVSDGLRSELDNNNNNNNEVTGVEAASVHVQAGHFDDTIAGLAHFHEHMLFLGNEKYPSEDEYESFLSQFGGFGNAFTDMEDTNYYFSITTKAEADGTITKGLHGALDRLANFFISPTFDEDAVERELRAIDSEYRNAKTNDAWRNFQLLKGACDPRHPFGKFGCGNYETLTSKGIDHLLAELHRFWKVYYRTYNMRLAVVGHGSLDNLQNTVEQTFGQLAYSDDPPRHVKSLPKQYFSRENAVYDGIPAFGPDQMGLRRDVIPMTEMRSVKLYFATPPLDDPVVRTTKPYRVISHIIGHESQHSLHALLNEEGYILGLSSGIGIDASDFSLFSLTVSLTPKGMQNYEKVLDLCFQWIAILKENESRLGDYHDELNQIASTNFRFRENGDPTDFCSTASELLFDEVTKPNELLLGQSRGSEYDSALARAFLDRIRPDNCMITILNSDLKNEKMQDESEWQVEPWYGAPFRLSQIPVSQKQAWEFQSQRDDRLKLPALNKYIPTDFSLRCDDDNADDSDNVAAATSDLNEIMVPPMLLISTPPMRMWHKMDRHWHIPKTFVKVALLSSKPYQTPRTMTLARIFTRVLNDDLNSFVYDASMAGCSYRVSCTPFGFRISVHGYSEKLSFLFETLTTRILSLVEDMRQGKAPHLIDQFEKAKEGLLRETKNYRYDPPYEVGNYNSRLLIEESVWHLDNYVDELEGLEAEKDPLTMEECAEVAAQCFMGRVKCEALCMGNINETGAREVAGILDSHFLSTSKTLSEAETPRFRSLKLPTRDEAVAIFGTKNVTARAHPLVYQDIAFSDTEENNAVEVILQVGCEFDLGYQGVAILDLISHMAYNSAYNQLRTKEQLGYIVSAFSRKTAGSTWGLSLVVQSSVALPDVLEDRCEAWLQTFRRELEAMSPTSFAKEASAVVAQLLEKETKLSQEVTRVFGEILNTEGLSDKMRTPAFDRLVKIAEELSVEQLVEPDDAGDGRDDNTIRTPSELKEHVLAFFDKHFALRSPHRRSMSARVYSQNSRQHYDDNIGQPGILSTHSEMRHYKLFLSSWPSVPYWRIEDNIEDNNVKFSTAASTTSSR